MKRNPLIVALILGLFVLSAALTVPSVYAQDHAQTKCPVLGYPIDKNVYADYNGKRVYFCCTSCIEKFKANPESYIKKLEGEGITLPKAGS
jgi:YHS domain-containing protein